MLAAVMLLFRFHSHTSYIVRIHVPRSGSTFLHQQALCKMTMLHTTRDVFVMLISLNQSVRSYSACYSDLK
jgi:hypothetical protein